MAASMRSYFDLNIGEILEGWEPRHAVREIIANALDEQALTGTKDVLVQKAEGAWIIRDYGRGLRVEHLKQSESAEKLNAANATKVVGRFGVGLKDALATLHRHDVQVQIYSQHHDIGIEERSKAGFDEVQTLHAAIGSPTEPMRTGTTVALRGIADAEIRAAQDFFLRFSGEEVLGETPHGQILRRHPQRPARVFIKGVLVAEEARFAFSYNVTSLTAAMTKALNRERTNVGRTAFADRIKAMLLACDAPVVAKILAHELEGIEAGTAHDEVLSWSDVAVHACKILNQSNIVVFVSARDLAENPDAIDHARGEGNEILTLPQSIRDKIRGIRDRSGTPIRSLDEFNRERAKSFKFDFVSEAQLTDAERAVYSRLHDIASLAGGLPKVVRDVMITNTMRPDDEGRSDALGLWNAVDRRIIIRRDQLQSLDDFAGTLLHEMIHASSGAGDVSRKFESALTDLIGRIAKLLLIQDPTSTSAPDAPIATDNRASLNSAVVVDENVRRQAALDAFHEFLLSNDVPLEQFIERLQQHQEIWTVVKSLGIVDFAEMIAGRRAITTPDLQRRTRINDDQKNSIKEAILQVLENQRNGMNRAELAAAIIAAGLAPHEIEHAALPVKARQPLHELVTEGKISTVGEKRLMKYVLGVR